MPKLNQVIAVVSSKKSQAQRDLTDVYQKMQKPAMFSGISRTYTPSDEDGELLPPESTRVQYTVDNAVTEVKQALRDMFDTVATQDRANCEAFADVLIGGNVVIGNVPVTTLLFLEKQVADLSTFVNKIPVLDPAEEWSFSENHNCYRSEPYFTNRTKKVPRANVLYEATDKHPAQVESYTEDVKAGEWKTVKFSGCMPATEREQIKQRIRDLQEALKFARERANQSEAENVAIGDKVLDFVFRAQS
jgi:hypothetical protein